MSDEQITETKIDESVKTAPQNTQNTTPSVPNEEETPQSIDWKRFKEQRKVERQQLEEEKKRHSQKAQEAEALKAALEALVNKPTSSSNGDIEETDDDRIQKKIDKALADERRRVEEERVRKEHAEFPQRLSSTYSDFDSVCTAENIDYLEYHHPEMARAFKKAPDSYEKWSDVYKAIKKYIPNNASNKDQKKAEKNFNKPQSMSVAGVTQSGDEAPRMLDDKRKADNWSRMQKRMRGIA